MAASLFTGTGRGLASALCAVGALALMSAQEASAQSLIRDAEIEDTLRVYETPLLRAAGLDPNDVNLYIIRIRA
jgi:predicted Zn-dependent protease